MSDARNDSISRIFFSICFTHLLFLVLRKLNCAIKTLTNNFERPQIRSVETVPDLQRTHILLQSGK